LTLLEQIEAIALVVVFFEGGVVQRRGSRRVAIEGNKVTPTFSPILRVLDRNLQGLVKALEPLPGRDPIAQVMGHE